VISLLLFLLASCVVAVEDSVEPFQPRYGRADDTAPAEMSSGPDSVRIATTAMVEGIAGLMLVRDDGTTKQVAWGVPVGVLSIALVTPGSFQVVAFDADLKLCIETAPASYSAGDTLGWSVYSMPGDLDTATWSCSVQAH
jgi:hypothetical protein